MLYEVEPTRAPSSERVGGKQIRVSERSRTHAGIALKFWFLGGKK